MVLFRNFFSRLFVCVFVFLHCYCFFINNLAYSVKIVAIVNDVVITDVDVEEFEQVLCKIDRRFKCGSQESKYVSLQGLVESNLKLEHFKQIDIGVEKQKIDKNFISYKKQVLKNIKISPSNIPNSFENYLYAEYIWSIMMASQANSEKISAIEIQNIMKEKNIKKEEEAKNIIFQNKISTISQKTIAELKKFYYVEIKGL